LRQNGHEILEKEAAELIKAFRLRKVTAMRRLAEMAASTRFCDLDAFRREWVSGHLDYQRAADALELARRMAAAICKGTDRADPDELHRAEQRIEEARRRLSDIASFLGMQFDRFCSRTR
jgi:hypothetical protein